MSKLLGREKSSDVFAEEYLGRHGVPPRVGQDLFAALRNGLAHIYSPYPIFVEGLEVQPTMTWKDGAGAHLHVVIGSLNNEGHLLLGPFQERTVPRLCLNVESMVNDLNDLFAELESRLLADADLRATVERRAVEMRTEKSKYPSGDAADTWRAFLNARKLPEPPGMPPG